MVFLVGERPFCICPRKIISTNDSSYVIHRTQSHNVDTAYCPHHLFFQFQALSHKHLFPRTTAYYDLLTQQKAPSLCNQCERKDH